MPPKSRNDAPKIGRGLLIVDHGTRSESANARLAVFADRIASERPGWLVVHAHMELAAPNFEQAIDSLVRSGANRILVHLHFLGSGYHVRESIPQLVDAARERHPQVEIQTSTPIGDDPRLLQIVVDRMDAHATTDEKG
jgi:sirohydrochlorin ferrochelatase